MPLTDAGWRAATAGEWIQRVRDTLDATRGYSGDYAPDTADGQWTSAAGLVIADVDAGVQLAVDALDPRRARRSALDAAAAPRVTRLPAVASRYTVRAGAAGTVTAGDVYRGGGDDGLEEWRVVTTAAVSVGSLVVVEAVEAGVVVLSGTVTLRAVTAPAGVTTLTYDPSDGDAFAVGRAVESDAQLRARWAASPATVGSPTGPGMQLTIRSLPWVVAVGVSRPAAGSLLVTVVPAPVGADQEEQLARAIYACSSAGAAYTGTDGSLVIAGADGQPVTVSWDVGATQAVTVALTLTLAPSVSLASVEDVVAEAVEAVFVGLAPGETLRLVDVLCAAAEVDGVVDVSATLNGSAANVTPAQPVDVLVPGTVTVGV